MIYILMLFLASCSPAPEKQEEFTKYSNVPPYSIVIEIEKEEKKWNQKK
jgi:hypothetical protein